MNIPSGLYAIQEPAAPARRKTLHIRLLCLHEPPYTDPVALRMYIFFLPPSPRRHPCSNGPKGEPCILPS